MNFAILQNGDVLRRILLLSVPTAASFLIAVVSLFITMGKARRAESGGEELKAVAMIFLSIYMTTFLYAVLVVLLMFYHDRIPVDRIMGESELFFVGIGALNAVSCIAKGIAGVIKLPLCVGEEKPREMSKVMLYMAAAEIPGLIAFALCMIKLML